MRDARERGLWRREKARMVAAVLAPALLILAMGPLALLRPAPPPAPSVPTAVTPSATVSPHVSPTATVRLRRTPPVIHSTKTPARPGDVRRRP